MSRGCSNGLLSAAEMAVVFAVGTLNEGKLASVRAALAGWDQDGINVTYKGVSVPSGVADQPIGIDETVRGAENRAKAAYYEVEDATVGIGIESGVVQVGAKLFDVAACSVFESRSGSRDPGQSAQEDYLYHTGLSSMFALPPKVARVFLEVGYNQAFESSFPGIDADATGGGVLSLMSEGRLSRPGQMAEAVNNALMSYLRPAFYRE